MYSRIQQEHSAGARTWPDSGSASAEMGPPWGRLPEDPRRSSRGSTSPIAGPSCGLGQILRIVCSGSRFQGLQHAGGRSCGRGTVLRAGSAAAGQLILRLRIGGLQPASPADCCVCCLRSCSCTRDESDRSH